MSKIKKTETVVRAILEENKEARDDDFLLVALACRRFCPSIMGETFTSVLSQHKQYGLPSFESITRARRKLQANNESLRGSERMRRIRNEEEEEFRDYANE